MTYIYKTLNGVAQKFNKETWAFKQAKELIPSYEGFVATGVLTRRDVLDNAAGLGEDAAAHLEMYQGSDGKFYIATNATKTPAGSLSDGGKKGDIVTTVYLATSINKSGNTALTAGSDLVIGAGGRITLKQSTDVSLMSNVAAAAATHDFDNSVWLTNGEVINVKTDADDVTARGDSITFYFINADDEFDSEVIVLDGTDSSVLVSGVKLCKKLVAILASAITTATLQVKDNAGNNCVQIATPTAQVYGTVLTDDSDTANGMRVKVTASVSVTGKVVIVGTNQADAAQYEVLNFVAETSKYSTKSWKTVTALYIGDDGVAFGGITWSVQTNDTSLMSNVASAASADFDNSVWGVDGTKLRLDTSVDDATARGAVVTLIFINSVGEVDSEQVTLDETDSSIDVYSLKKCLRLLAYSLNQSISTATLRIKAEDGDVCKSQATPATGTLYGSVLTDDSDDPKGHSVFVNADPAPVANSYLVVKGTDDNSAELFEKILCDGTTQTYRTTKQFKTITHVLVGDDGVATGVYSMSIPGNVAGEVIGTSPINVAANTDFELTRA